MTTGVVLHGGDIDRFGDTLAVATAATDTVLHVDDVGDFAETGEPGERDDFALASQWLVIGSSAPMEYVATDDETETITLAAPVGAVFEAGEPVRVWDPSIHPNGGVAVQYWVPVLLDEADDDEEPVPALVLDDKIPQVTAGDLQALVGARVRLAQDDDADPDDEWHIAEVLGRGTVWSADAIDTPAASLYRTTDTAPIATSSWTVMTGWTVRNIDGFAGLDTGWLTIALTGRYLVTSVQNWANNTTGGRRARLRRRNLAGLEETVSPEFRTAPDPTLGDASPTIAHPIYLLAGEAIQVQVWQNTGAGLAVTGDSGGLRTTWHITYMGPT